MEKNFFALEGQDGAGKTVQLDLLRKRLNNEGQKVRVVDLPQYGHPSARWVEKYLQGGYGSPDKVNPYLAASFYAFDRHEAGLKARKWLKKSYVVLANRWVASNLAHQGTKFSSPRQLQKFFDWVIELEYMILEEPKPLTIILHVPAEVSFELVKRRGRERDGHEKSLQHLRRAEAIYKKMTELWPRENRLIECYEDGRLLTPKEIHEKVWKIVSPLP